MLLTCMDCCGAPLGYTRQHFFVFIHHLLRRWDMRFRTFSDVFGRFHAINIFVTFFLRQGRKKGRHRWNTTSILFPAVSLDFVRFASKKVDFCTFFFLFKKINPKLILRRFACFKSQFCGTGQEVKYFYCFIQVWKVSYGKLSTFYR